MDLFDVLRKLFVGTNIPNQDWHRKNSFRNPIWQNDEDDDEDYEGDFRNQKKIENGEPLLDDGIGHAASFPDVFHFFSKSIRDEIFNNFFQGFQDGMFEFNFIDPQSQQSLPQIEGPKQSLRDRFLKRDIPGINSDPKHDISLDGKITPENLSELWKKSESSPDTESLLRQPQIQSCVRSYQSQVVTTPNGRELRSTVTDCDGNVTTTIKKQTGDKIHTVTIKKDKNGLETRNEDIVEADKNQLILKDDIEPKMQFPFEPIHDFPWSKFFDPKL